MKRLRVELDIPAGIQSISDGHPHIPPLHRKTVTSLVFKQKKLRFIFALTLIFRIDKPEFRPAGIGKNF